MTDKTQLEGMHDQIETIYTGCAHVECDVLHRYIDTQDAVVKSKLRQIDDLTVRAAILQSDSEKYKAAKNEMQLVAGRYQFQFEQAMKCINSIDDLFEYAYKGVGRTALRDMVRSYLAVFTAAVKPKGK